MPAPVKRPWIRLFLLVFLFAAAIYLFRAMQPSEQTKQKAFMASVEKSLAADKPLYEEEKRFASTVKQMDDYAESLVEQDVSAKTKEWMNIGMRDRHDLPQHPRILRKPYPTIEEVEAAVGHADATELPKNSDRLYSTLCVPPMRVWHMSNPECTQKNARDHTSARCDSILLKAAFSSDGKLCRLTTYSYGTEEIGRNWGWWSLNVYGTGDQHPIFDSK